jgi:prepilin-type N-terminal cleavage/methylation domain-containing protein
MMEPSMPRSKGRSEAGFSLVELTVAMTITLIITGAVYGLLTAGNSAFRREPEAADRQQNIRVAMSMIQADLFRAGAALDSGIAGNTVQVFRRGLDGVSGLGGVTGNVDYLEFLAADAECPQMAAGNPASASTAFKASAKLSGCFPVPSLGGAPTFGGVLVRLSDGQVRWGIGSGDAATQGTIAFSPGGQPAAATIHSATDLDPGGPGATPDPVSALPLHLVRYEVANEAGTTRRALFRSIRGGLDNTGAYVAAPGAAGLWQEVAVGVEDLQVRYQDTGGAWTDEPPVMVDATTLVRDVQVTLTARAQAPGLQGSSTFGAAGLGGAALRGQLVTRVTPRATLVALEAAGTFR